MDFLVVMEVGKFPRHLEKLNIGLSFSFSFSSMYGRLLLLSFVEGEEG